MISVNYYFNMGMWKQYFQRVLVNKILNSREFIGNKNEEKKIRELWFRVLKRFFNLVILLSNVFLDFLSFYIFIQKMRIFFIFEL